MLIAIDIETIPGQGAQAKELAKAGIKPPATLKKAESIAAWWAEESDQAAHDAWLKQSLDGGNHGEIISIAMATDGMGNWVRCRQQGQSEAELLEDFGLAVSNLLDTQAVTGGDGRIWPVGEPFFVAHNASFDLGFLWRRAIINGVRLPFKLPSPSARSGKDFGDTMLAWAGYGQRISLDALCKALSIESPKDSGFDGSQVFGAWMDGLYSEIAAYNLSDAKATLQIWNRIQGARP